MTQPDSAREVAGRLTKVQAEFLCRVVDERKLCLADRIEDRARQSVRRLGLVQVLKEPRRWAATSSGIAVRRILQENRDGE